MPTRNKIAIALSALVVLVAVVVQQQGWARASRIVLALVATLLVALIARTIILRRDKRNAMKIVRTIVARAASENENEE
jgi:hypothetical protein